ncbi:MAG: protein phosphatase 2C domain-containing protein [Blautia sp.]|uniref:PP2C family protein-serine/threonine phosphatase n=1 Tax=Blautia sp. TaxID=1955243 RepID=UPI002584907C|nr:protein phosphatase 2C domain-containing protein [Blautia sp.]MCI7288113.1 protein phosphatase 2C domain-containing protein [Blautia sp.]MDD7454026.1 protein phosphatase 2C domain-containing protein [Blautia obeum]MDY2752342.1 protein phosphatase 2C domain-containing protein [Blautia obeum]
MAYQIEYAYTCHIGKIRNNNEDNFWCCGDSLEAQNQGMSHIRSGYMKQSEYPLLAVFDGMGGESCGEMAAFLAAEACGEHFKTAKDGIRNDPEEFLNEICESMNQAICDYGRTNKINSMGTTAALLAFAEDAVYSCNLGDSRIYKSDREKFYQISQDHVLGRSLFGKAPLTQYLGMEEENLQLEPSISRQEIKIGNRFLLCSDGITDMLSDGEIADILSRDIPVAKTVEILVDRALKKGGRDNITVVLCEIMEQPRNMFRRVLNWFHRQNEGDI